MTETHDLDQQRGRHAENPKEIPAPGWKDILLRTKAELADDHVSVVAAGVAFFGLLATFPAIAALIALAGLIAEPATIVTQIDAWTAGLPADAAEIFKEQARKVATAPNHSLGLAALISILLAIYGAAKGMKSLMEGMNVAYDEPEERGFIRLNAVALVLTVLLMAGLLVAIGFLIVVPIWLEALGLGSIAETIASLVRWLLLTAIAVVGLSLLYRYGPSRDDPKWRWATPGSVLAVIVWVIGSAAFSWYVSRFGSYNETYGALGGVIILLTWMWLSAYIILLGAELNSEIERQTKRDTTTGPAKPMGERDAVVADTVGEAQE